MRVLACLTLVVLVACGDDASVDVRGPESQTNPSEADEIRYQGTGMVLQEASGTAQLCQSVLTSLPPQCGGGVELVDWSWDLVDDEETSRSVTWGDYEVTVTVDGDRFNVIDAGPPRHRPSEAAEPDFTTPCPEPPGGWATTVDHSLLTLEDLTAFHTYVDAQPDRSASWNDSTTDPKFDPDDLGSYVYDPAAAVTNIRFTQDSERHEAEIRAIWGGPICVMEGGLPGTEMLDRFQKIARDLESVGGHPVGGSVDEVGGRFVFNVVLEDPEAQAELDQQYGPGVVVIEPQLVRVEAP